MRSSAVFKLQCIFLMLRPKFDPVAMPGKAVPGEAASIIFPKNNGNKLVENAVKAIKTIPNMNLPR